MYFDRFDVCAAYWHFLQHHWNGVHDPLYARFCRLTGYYTPSTQEERLEGLSENARAIYDALCAEHSG